MKNILFRLALYSAVVIFLLLGLQDCATTYQSQNSSYNNNANDWGYNISDLNNYGEWVQTNIYGEAWRPYVAPGWTPFENGHWAYANGNWTWISYEPFGWIVYHYGNWYNDPFYGWVWIPSSGPWSPARVVWYNYDNYVAWAPMPPPHVSYGTPWEPSHHHYWHVVKSRDFTNDNIQNYRVENPARNNTALRNNAGTRNAPERTPPSVQVIRNATGKSVPEVKVKRERVNLPKRNVERIVLPAPEEKRVEENTTKVKKRELIPRDEYIKREAQKREKQKEEMLRKKQQKKEQQKTEPQKEERQKKEPPKREPRKRGQNQRSR